jgi:hypothetical protein
MACWIFTISNVRNINARRSVSSGNSRIKSSNSGSVYRL